MSNEAMTDDAWGRFEGLIAAWQGGASEEQGVLTAAATQLREQVESLFRGLEAGRERACATSNEAMAALQDLRRAQPDVPAFESRIAALENALEDGAQEYRAASQQLEEVQESLREARESEQATAARATQFETLLSERDGEAVLLRGRVRELEEALEAARAENDGLGQELALLRQRADRADGFREQLMAEQERVAKLSERLRAETSNGTRSALAQQLAQALEENENAAEELAALRVALARQQTAETAGCSIDPPAQAAEPMAADAEASPAAGADMSADAVEALEAVLAEADGKRHKLGAVLVESGVISAEQFALAMEEQRQSPDRRFETILVDKGFVGEDVVAKALANQGNAPYVRLDEEQLQEDAARLITNRLAQLHTVIPIRATEDTLILAVANPMDLIAIEDVERASRRRVEPVVAAASDIRAAIERVYV